MCDKAFCSWPWRVPVQLQEVVYALLGLGELLDFAAEDVCVGYLTSVLGQEPLEVLGVDCVGLLLDQVLDALLLLLVRKADLFTDLRHGDICCVDAVLEALLDSVFLEQLKLTLHLVEQLRVLPYDVYCFCNL